MIELEPRERLDFDLDCGEDVVQGAAERCTMVSQSAARVNWRRGYLLMNPTLRPGCSCKIPSSIFREREGEVSRRSRYRPSNKLRMHAHGEWSCGLRLSRERSRVHRCSADPELKDMG